MVKIILQNVERKIKKKKCLLRNRDWTKITRNIMLLILVFIRLLFLLWVSTRILSIAFILYMNRLLFLRTMNYHVMVYGTCSRINKPNNLEEFSYSFLVIWCCLRTNSTQRDNNSCDLFIQKIFLNSKWNDLRFYCNDACLWFFRVFFITFWSSKTVSEFNFDSDFWRKLEQVGTLGGHK